MSSTSGGPRKGGRRADPPPPLAATLADAGRRIVGLLFVGLVAVPAFQILDPSDFAQRLMRAGGAEHWRFTWLGAAIAVAVASVTALLTRGRAGRALAWAGARLATPPRGVFALGVAVLGAALTTWVSLAVFDGRTTLNDASVQLIQGRYFAAGRLSGPVLAQPEFWSVQFMVLTGAGWVSQYPPAHAAWLAVGFVLGAPWLAMALAVAAMGAILVCALERLLPGRPAEARLAALLTVASPLLLGLAAGYMNHATVAALGATALYCALRAERGTAVWALGAGAAMGAMVTTRPVSGLVIGLVVTLGVWLTAGPAARGLSSGEGRRWLGRRLAAWVAGGAPFAAAFAWFNARFFGSPLTLGYVAASGPNHGLGFHEDPWGRLYTPTQALGYTAAELAALGRELLGTPLPIVALIGVFLLVAHRLARGERILLAWAGLPLVASALYWHHDLVFGPRMLADALPAWCALAVIAAVALARKGKGSWTSETLVLTLLLALGYALVSGGPSRFGRYAARLGPHPPVDASSPSLVFVHEAWADRVGGRLAGRGMRLDSVRTLLTRYHPCQLEAALAGRPVEEIMERCRREEASDALGAVGVTSLLWLDDLPGLPPRGPLWARDLGPEANAELIARHPDRVPLFLLPPEPGGGEEWRVVPYEQGVTRLWGASDAAERLSPR